MQGQVGEANLKNKTVLLLDFPGGTVDKNLPADAGDTGSIPDPGRAHLLWGD